MPIPEKAHGQRPWPFPHTCRGAMYPSRLQAMPYGRSSARRRRFCEETDNVRAVLDFVTPRSRTISVTKANPCVGVEVVGYVRLVDTRGVWATVVRYMLTGRY